MVRLPQQENQRHQPGEDDGQQQEGVDVGQHGGLALHHGVELGLRLVERVGSVGGADQVGQRAAAMREDLGFRPQRELVAAVNGGGKIDTRAMEAADVTAAVNGGGNLLVRAAARLTGAVRGGGSVRYWGNPVVTSATQGGGWIGRGN